MKCSKTRAKRAPTILIWPTHPAAGPTNDPVKGRWPMTAPPPVLGLVGRERSQIRLAVCADTTQDTIQPEVERKTAPTTTLYTDESNAYERVAETGRGHGTVCHSQKEWARDDDGDGIREVHCNTMEGIWTGLRNFLRPFRGVHKKTWLSTWRCLSGLNTIHQFR